MGILKKRLYFTMAYVVAPNTDLRILKNVPLNNTYEHTVFFSNASTQAAIFQTYTKYTFTNLSYVRTNNGIIRVEQSADNLQDCNYIMFRNTSFGSKWFYAFIREVNYINNKTAEIVYDIDIMQTWFMFNVTVGQSFIAREHPNSDIRGNNLQPENFNLGEYKESFITDVIGDREMYINVWASFDYNSNNPDNNNIEHYTYTDGNGVTRNFVTGVTCNSFPMTTEGLANFNQFIGIARSAINPSANIEGIIAIVIAPTNGWATWSIGGNIGNNIDGYVPKNQKLLTYPYTSLYVTNMQGNTATYPFEYFVGTSSNDWNFVVYTSGLPNATCAVVPYYYKGSSYNYDESLTFKGFTQVPIETNFFQQYCAQSLAQLPLSIGKTALGAAVGGSVGAIAGGLSSAISLVEGGVKASMQPNQVIGNNSQDGLALFGFADMKIYQKYITAEYARAIDDYFERYGYATNRVKRPNITGRPYWNYVKTVNCVITSNGAPSSAVNEIAKIFDNGITFWHDITNVGNYLLNNH